MIWKSVALMTVVDLLIISAVAYSFRVFLVYRRLLAEAKPRVGLTAVVAGLLLVAAFYAADLAVMHVLPLFLAKDVAVAVMTDLHLDYHWIVTVIGVGAIAFGFAVITRQMSDSVERSRRSEERYEFVVAGTQDGIWDWDIRMDELYLSPRWTAILGYEDHEFEKSFESFFKALHPDAHSCSTCAVVAETAS